MTGCVVFGMGLSLGGINVTEIGWWIAFLGLMIVYFNKK